MRAIRAYIWVGQSSVVAVQYNHVYGHSPAKAELVLAYEEDLKQHLEAVQAINDKADRVLDVKAWPDFRDYTEKLSKLETITKEQQLQSIQIDKRTEELIEVYNEIITSFRNNIGIWNQKLDVYENEIRNEDEDV